MCRARGAGRRLPQSFPRSAQGKACGTEGLERISSALAGSPIPPSFSPWRCQIAEGLLERARISVAYHLLISPRAGNGKCLGWLWQLPIPASHQGTERSRASLGPEGRGSIPTTHSTAGDGAAPAPGGKHSQDATSHCHRGWGLCSSSWPGTKPHSAPAIASLGQMQSKALRAQPGAVGCVGCPRWKG